MDNLIQILIMFLVAALNTFIVALAVRLIFKIRVDKKEITEQVRNEIAEDIPPIVNSELRKTQILKEEQTATKDAAEKKDKPEEKESKPKFLKYTSKGYITPENDEEKKQHIWR